MAVNLTDQVRGIAPVTTAVANGDLSKKITVEAKGEVAALADTINTMVDQLRSFAAEVTRVAREVGTEGQLGGQARGRGRVGHVARPHRQRELHGRQPDLPGAQHRPGGDRGGQRRPRPEDHRRRAGRDPRAQADASTSWSTSCPRSPTRSRAWRARSAPRASSAARPESRASSGTWRDLTENVNQLAGNLTTQVRAIAEVSTAVTQGDLTRSITVQAEGEVAELKDNINQMIENLRETTKVNAEQDWLKTNLARISGMLQGQRDIEPGDPADHERGHPGGQRPARRAVPRRARRLARRGRAARRRLLRLQAQEGPPGPLRARRRPRGPGGGRGQDDPPDRRPRRLHQDLLGARRGHAGAPRRHAGHVRGAGPRRHRARRAAALQRRSTRPSWTSSRTPSAWSSTRSRPTCAPSSC